MVGRSCIYALLILCSQLSAQVVGHNGSIVQHNNSSLQYTGTALNVYNNGRTDTAYVYFVMGQSNTGQSSTDSIPTDSAMYKGLITNSKIYNPLYQSALLPMNVGLNTHVRALGWENPYPKGFDGEGVLAYKMSQQTDKELVFFKYGVGSSTLGTHWRKGYWMYDSAIIKYAPKMIDAVLAENKIPIVKAMIWIQGESDDVDSATYHGYLSSFFDSISADLDSVYLTKGLIFNESYKKLIIQLKPGSAMYTKGVEDAQKAYCGIPNNNAVLIGTTDVQTLADNTHYSWRGHLKIGWKLYNTLR